ncbi:probable ADP-ribosylation factor GTPase-activating protein AGD14 isoform X1 [Nymphaea colorata]|nr:probable ADP-ribosylation factor GTPase-activating protein AGD14 isoform X1 [Nymphaea colorata]
MANRMKEDEKNEKIIRGLLKLPANRKCINCNSLGPQYVCTTFWTFVCTTCSGIHREFTHRVKSVSMAKFSSQEVNALQTGGNERAREIYFKEWDPQRHSAPDSSNPDRLRDFIKHVYVDRRYTGERSADRPPRVKMGDREDSNDRRSDAYRGDSRSPSYEDVYDRRRRPEQGRYDDRGYDDRNAKYGYDDKRSPSRYEDTYKRSPARFEVVDDRFRDDKFGNVNQSRKYEDRRFPDGPSRIEERSPNNQRDSGISSPPVVRPVRDILGEDVPPLKVGDPPKLNGPKAADGSAHAQRTSSSSSMASTEGSTPQLKRVNSGSLIDFSAEPAAPVTAAQPVPFSSHAVSQPSANPSVGSNNWASFDNSSQEKAAATSSNATKPVSVLEQLSVQTTAIPVGGVNPLLSTGMGGQWQVTQQQQPSLFPGTDGQSANMQFAQPVNAVPNSQPWNSMPTPNAQPQVTVQTTHLSQAAPRPSQEALGAASQPNPVDAKPNVRKALPEDIFSLYSMAPAPVPRWQPGPQVGMNFVGQYPAAMTMTTFPQSSKSTNPFDLSNEPVLGPVNPFPSMSSLQGALPNVPTPVVMHNTSFVAPASQWQPSQTPAFPMSMAPGSYMAQHIPNSLQTVGLQPGLGSFGGGGLVNGPLGGGPPPAVGGPQQSVPNSFSSLGGNPFG